MSENKELSGDQPAKKPPTDKERAASTLPEVVYCVREFGDERGDLDDSWLLANVSAKGAAVAPCDNDTGIVGEYRLVRKLRVKVEAVPPIVTIEPAE